MKLQISQQEAQNTLRKKSHFDINFQIIDQKTFKIGWSLISLEIKIVKLENEKFYMTCNSSMINSALGFLSGKWPLLNSFIDINNGEIIVHLNKIPDLHKVLSEIEVDDISFVDNNLEVNFHLKGVVA